MKIVANTSIFIHLPRVIFAVVQGQWLTPLLEMRCRSFGVTQCGKTSEAVLLAQLRVLEPLIRGVLRLDALRPAQMLDSDRFRPIMRLIFAIISDKGSENSSGLADSHVSSVLDPAQGPIVRSFCDAHGHSNTMKAACNSPTSATSSLEIVEPTTGAADLAVGSAKGNSASARGGAAYANIIGPLLTTTTAIRKSPSGHNALAAKGGVRLKVESE